MKSFTIITPSYNHSAYIRDTLESVVRQKGDFILDYIVMDGGSKDNTSEILKKMEEDMKREALEESEWLSADVMRFPEESPYGGCRGIRFRWFSEKDNGQAHAINKGFNLAEGNYVGWLNSDDYFHNENVLEKILNAFDKDSADIVTSDGIYVEENGEYNRDIVLKEIIENINRLKYYDFILQPSTFWKRNDIRLDETLHYTFDWKFFAEFYNRGLKYTYLPEKSSCYRIQQESKTFLDNASRKAEVLKVLKTNRTGVLTLMWAWTVYWGYRLTEKTGIGIFRWLVRKSNVVMGIVSSYRIYSC